MHSAGESARQIYDSQGQIQALACTISRAKVLKMVYINRSPLGGGFCPSKSVWKVVLQKSNSAQICQLFLYHH